MTPVHEAVLSALDGGGGLFFRMLADRVDRPAAGAGPGARPATPRVAAAIWDLVWAGRLTNDTLAALRTVLGTGRPVRPATGTASGPAAAGPAACAAAGAAPAVRAERGRGERGRAGRRTPPRRGPDRRGPDRRRRPAPAARPCQRTGPPTVTGRWSLVPPADPDPTRRLHARGPHPARPARHPDPRRGGQRAGAGGFAAIYPVLRAMEDAGQCRRGYFVEGLGAAQFALPGAVDRMRAMAADAEPA